MSEMEWVASLESILYIYKKWVGKYKIACLFQSFSPLRRSILYLHSCAQYYIDVKPMLAKLLKLISKLFKCLGILFHIVFQNNSSKQLDPPSNIFGVSKMHSKFSAHEVG